jgi:hypothetical protein
MTTKEPTPPPPKKRLCEHADAEFIIGLALRWRCEQIRQDAIAEASYALALGHALDSMVHDLTHPPTSPPPPRKQ